MEGAFWMMIPIVAIVAGTVKEWIRVRARQRQLGSSNDHLEKQVTELRSRERDLIDRLENLEAIVVSQTWDVVHDKSLPPAVKELKLSSVAPHEMAPASVQNSQRAEVLARRLKG
jgi:hypothetical protein